MTSIVAASDASEQSDAVVAAAVELGAKLDAEVKVVHVLTESRLADLRQSLGQEEAYTDAVMTLLLDALGDQFERVGISAEQASKHILQGPVGSSLLDYARSSNAGYLALGLKNRSRVGKFLLGSDVQQVLLSTPCVVIGVPIP